MSSEELGEVKGRWVGSKRRVDSFSRKVGGGRSQVCGGSRLDVAEEGWV